MVSVGGVNSAVNCVAGWAVWAGMAWHENRGSGQEQRAATICLRKRPAAAIVFHLPSLTVSGLFLPSC